MVVDLLPLVLAALLDGEDRPGQGVVFARHLARLATGQLQERIERMILEIDPDFYEARYRKALRGRRVVHYLDPDGTCSPRASPAADHHIPTGTDPAAGEADPPPF